MHLTVGYGSAGLEVVRESGIKILSSDLYTGIQRDGDRKMEREKEKEERR